MATCSADGTARVWDCATGEQLYEFVGEPNECACSVAYRPQVNYTCGKNGSDVTKAKTVRALAVGFSGGASRVYDVETTAVIAEHRQHKGDVVSVQFTPDGSRMITAGGEGNLCVYDAKNGYLPVKYLATVRVFFFFLISGNYNDLYVFTYRRCPRTAYAPRYPRTASYSRRSVLTARPRSCSRRTA